MTRPRFIALARHIVGPIYGFRATSQLDRLRVGC